MKMHAGKKGFTLTELMIVMSIIGLLAAIGIPTMMSSGRQARSKRFAREIRVASEAFVQYAFENGGYPADTLPGQMPAGMNIYLSRFHWQEDTPVGGQWDWDFQQFGTYAAVSVHSPNYGTEHMTEIDNLIDDGNLGSGSFRSRSGGYMYVIEEPVE